MPLVRTKGPDIVVRYAGRRVRVGKEWGEVVVDAMERLLTEGGNDLEIQDVSATGPKAGSGGEKGKGRKPKGDENPIAAPESKPEPDAQGGGGADPQVE